MPHSRVVEKEDDRARDRRYPAPIDLDFVWDYLSTKPYWGRWRTRDQISAQVRGAWRVVGAYEPGSGAQVGFARAVSDGVGVAYLADVFVLDHLHGRGIGTAMVRRMIEEGPGTEFRWMLHTRDAHRLYESFGFRVADTRYLERPGSSSG